MKIVVLEKCQINGAWANPGDILHCEDGAAMALEAHGYVRFELEPETPKATHAEHKAPAHNIQHPHAKSHRA